MDKRRRAFSLVETMVAMFLIALTSGFLLAGFTSLHRGVHQNRFRLYAAVRAQEIALSRAQNSFDSQVSTSLESVSVTAGSEDGRTLTRTFRFRVEVTQTDPDRKIVRSLVTWDEPTGPQRFSVDFVVNKE